jgi:elongation factor G
MASPPAIVFLTIEPKTAADREKLKLGLGRLTADDPTLRVEADQATGRTILRGCGDLHIEIALDRLHREFDLQMILGELQVAYKERLTRPSEGEGRFVKQMGGRGQFAHVRIRVWPRGMGEGFSFENQIPGGVLPTRFIRPVEEGVRRALSAGVFGYPVEEDLRVELYDGSYHETDSSETAFQIVGALAFRMAAKEAQPVLVEPVMRVEILTPKEHLNVVRRDLLERRVRIEAEEESGGEQIFTVRSPLFRMLGYARVLRAITLGRGSYAMRFDRYEPSDPPDAEALPVGR